MSEYTFKPLNEVDTVEAPAGGTTVMGFQGGVPIQMPMGAVKYVKPLIIDVWNGVRPNRNDIIEALLTGRQIWMYDKDVLTDNSGDPRDHYYLISSFYLTQGTSTTTGLIPIESAEDDSYYIHLKYVIPGYSSQLIYKEYVC